MIVRKLLRVALLLSFAIPAGVTAAEGIDLSGAILSAPTSGVAGDEFEFLLLLENRGDRESPSFAYTISLVSEDGTPPHAASTELLHAGRVERLAGEGSVELRFDGVEEAKLRFPLQMRANRYHFVVRIDPDEEVIDVDPSNNRLVGQPPLQRRGPELQIVGSELFLSRDRCIYGEPIEATLEICNGGLEDATDFHPGLVMVDAGGGVTEAELAIVATSPLSCGPELSPAQRCEGEDLCVDRRCRTPCEADSECGISERCLEDPALASSLGLASAKSCMNRIPAPSQVGGGTPCREFLVRGRIPLLDREGAFLESGPLQLLFIDDAYGVLSQLASDVVSTTIHCDAILPDLIPTSLSLPATMSAGQRYSVRRTIRNQGKIEQPHEGPALEVQTFRYGYFLAPVGAEMSPAQIPAPLWATGGLGKFTVGAEADHVLTDVIVIPDSLQAGAYQLALIVDPLGEARELSKENNVLIHPTPIQISPSRLELLTTSLPPAVAGRRYTFQLAATGRQQEVHWEASQLPRGMRLDAGGLLSGIPTEVGTYVLHLRLSAGALQVERLVGLQVLPRTVGLEISTSALPIAKRAEAYGKEGGWLDEEGQLREGIPLVASGGLPPYRWELIGDPFTSRLPQGLELDPQQGVIAGIPTIGAITSRFEVQVTDSVGAQAIRELEIIVSDGSGLVILGQVFVDGRTAESYDSCVEASGMGSQAAYHWEVGEDTLPPGLGVEQVGSLVCLRGTPSRCGDYLVEASVSNEVGQTIRVSLPLNIECTWIQLVTSQLPKLERGASVSFELSAHPSAAPRYTLFQGLLPKGLVLQEEGRIEGTLADDALPGAYDLLLDIRDEEGRRGLGSLVLRVAAEPLVLSSSKGSSSGCGAAGGAPLGWLMVAAGVGMVAVRRRGGWGRLGDASVLTLAALVLALSALSCGGDEADEEEPSLCEGVQCGDEHSSCDPADGQCKCGGIGGVVCPVGGRCVLEPEPQCVSSGCDFVECAPGLRCDPITSSCVCGVEACGEQEICVQGACVPADLCAAVLCTVGESCNPEDGACTCGGLVCDAGESCDEGRCTADRCVGVHCSANSVCNPADGSCRCMGVEGPICVTGEACTPADPGTEGGAPGVCVPSDRCEGVVCGGAEVCDPDDGLCHCGGIGGLHPICGGGETCLAGRCVGGGGGTP